MKLIKILLVLSFLSVIFLTMACEDTDNTPESGTISGVITFLETWPETGTISISLNTSWPPTGSPYAFKTIESDDLNTNNEYSYSFENIAFGTYLALAVSWRNPDSTYNSSCNQSTLGAYGGSIQDYFMNLDSLTVSTTNYELTEYDFDADLNYTLPNPYSICQPPCTVFDIEADCTVENIYNLSMGHCMWDDNSGCGYKQ